MELPKPFVYSSVILAVLTAYASLSGIMLDDTYSREAEGWAAEGVGQDYGNLAAVTALLICSFYMAKGSARAFLVLTGTLLYLVYAYTLYAFFIHFNSLFLVYVAILGLSFYSLFSACVYAARAQIAERLHGGENKNAGLFLVLVGILFALLWLSDVVAAILSGTAPKNVAAYGFTVNPVHVIDLSVILPGMIITGILLRRKNALGLFFAVPFLWFSALMGLSIVFAMIVSAHRGLPSAVEPAVMVGFIVLLSAYYAGRMLKKAPADPKTPGNSFLAQHPKS